MFESASEEPGRAISVGNSHLWKAPSGRFLRVLISIVHQPGLNRSVFVAPIGNYHGLSRDPLLTGNL